MSLRERLKSIFDVYSRRNPPRDRRHKSDEVSAKVRAQIILFYRDLVSGRWGTYSHENHTYEFWEQMHNKLEHLHGRVYLSDLVTTNPGEDVFEFLQRCNSDEFFDFIELSFKLDITWRVMSDENEVVDAVNEIFRVENVPYQLTRIVKVEEKTTVSPFTHSHQGTAIRTVAYPRIVRVEEELAHREAVEPALSVLSAPHFEAANQEVRDAMNEYRKGDYEDCLAKCGSTFESVLKVLCKKNGWKYSEDDTAAKLLEVVFPKSTLKPFFKPPLMLIATMRNKLSSSHGGGSNVRNVKGHIAQYAVTITASAIVLLVQETDRQG